MTSGSASRLTRLSTSAILNRRSTNRGVATKPCTARPPSGVATLPADHRPVLFRRAEPACMITHNCPRTHSFAAVRYIGTAECLPVGFLYDELREPPGLDGQTRFRDACGVEALIAERSRPNR